MVANGDGPLVVGDRQVQGAVRRVVLEEVGVGGGGDQVVDADHLHRRCRAGGRLLEGGAHEVAPDPAKTVDAYPNSHGCSLVPVKKPA